MRKIAAVALLALSQTACLSLDFLFLDTPQTDAYEISSEIVPEDLIEPVTFEAKDGTVLYGYWAHQPVPSPPLIFFHGNGGHIGDNWDRVEFMWEWHTHDIFIFDYREFGMSEGTATFQGVMEQDGMAAVEHVMSWAIAEPEEIAWVALSLGGAVAIHTSDEIGAQALVMESTFASADQLLDEGTGLDVPTGWFFKGPYDNEDAIAKITTPILIIHGLDDDFINPESGPLLFDAAPKPKELWQPKGVGHSDLFEVKPDEFEDRASSFLASHE